MVFCKRYKFFFSLFYLNGNEKVEDVERYNKNRWMAMVGWCVKRGVASATQHIASAHQTTTLRLPAASTGNA
jgi:hypothetical protein